MKVYICGIVLVPDGPREVVGRGRVGRVIDESLQSFDLYKSFTVTFDALMVEHSHCDHLSHCEAINLERPVFHFHGRGP